MPTKSGKSVPMSPKAPAHSLRLNRRPNVIMQSFDAPSRCSGLLRIDLRSTAEFGEQIGAQITLASGRNNGHDELAFILRTARHLDGRDHIGAGRYAA